MTHQVAARCESSAGCPCQERNPLYSTISGAAKVVAMSSFPVLTIATVEVSMRSESEVRKKRSAGRAASLGIVLEAAMADFSIVASGRRCANEAGRKDNSHFFAGTDAAAAKAERATFLVRLEMGKPEISVSGTCLAPEKFGSFFT